MGFRQNKRHVIISSNNQSAHRSKYWAGNAIYSSCENTGKADQPYKQRLLSRIYIFRSYWKLSTNLWVFIPRVLPEKHDISDVSAFSDASTFTRLTPRAANQLIGWSRAAVATQTASFQPIGARSTFFALRVTTRAKQQQYFHQMLSNHFAMTVSQSSLYMCVVITR